MRSSCSLTFSMLGVSGGLSAALARVGVNVVGAAQRESRGENREESQRVRRQRHAVTQRDHAEQQEFVEDHRVAPPRAQQAHAARERRRRRGSRCPVRRPFPRRGRRRSSARRPAPSSWRPIRPRPNKTNGNAVPSLRPPSPVSPKRRLSRSCGAAQLHVRGEHRIRGREHRAEHQREPPVEIEQHHGDDGDADDGQHHRDGREPQRQAPAPVADRHAHLDAHGEQRDQQRDLGDGLEQRELAQRMQLEDIEDRRARAGSRPRDRSSPGSPAADREIARAARSPPAMRPTSTNQNAAIRAPCELQARRAPGLLRHRRRTTTAARRRRIPRRVGLSPIADLQVPVCS